MRVAVRHSKLIWATCHRRLYARPVRCNTVAAFDCNRRRARRDRRHPLHQIHSSSHRPMRAPAARFASLRAFACRAASSRSLRSSSACRVASSSAARLARSAPKNVRLPFPGDEVVERALAPMPAAVEGEREHAERDPRSVLSSPSDAPSLDATGPRGDQPTWLCRVVDPERRPALLAGETVSAVPAGGLWGSAGLRLVRHFRGFPVADTLGRRRAAPSPAVAVSAVASDERRAATASNARRRSTAHDRRRFSASHGLTCALLALSLRNRWRLRSAAVSAVGIFGRWMRLESSGATPTRSDEASLAASTSTRTSAPDTGATRSTAAQTSEPSSQRAHDCSIRRCRVRRALAATLYGRAVPLAERGGVGTHTSARLPGRLLCAGGGDGVRVQAERAEALAGLRVGVGGVFPSRSRPARAAAMRVTSWSRAATLRSALRSPANSSIISAVESLSRCRNTDSAGSVSIRRRSKYSRTASRR
jgi:hypothetical protein